MKTPGTVAGGASSAMAAAPAAATAAKKTAKIVVAIAVMIIAMMMMMIMTTMATTTTTTSAVTLSPFVLASSADDGRSPPPFYGSKNMDLASNVDFTGADASAASGTTSIAEAAAAAALPAETAVISSMKNGQHRSADVEDDDDSPSLYGVANSGDDDDDDDGDTDGEGTVLGSIGGSRYVHSHGRKAAMVHLNINEDRRDGTHHLRSGRSCQGLDCNRHLEDSASEGNDHETTIDTLYRKVDGMTCKTLQTFPGSEQYRYTAEEGSMLTEEHCQQVCTDLGVSCLGFEVSLKRSVISPWWQQADNATSSETVANEAFNGMMFNQTRCKFWNRRPIDFESTADQDIVLSSCIIKEYLAYNTTACQIGFIPSPGSNIKPTLLEDISLQECSKECERRTDVAYPVFGGTTNSDSQLCFGYMAQKDKKQCMIYHSPVFVLEGVTTQIETSPDRESYDALSLDGNVCVVRSQTVLVNPST